MINEINQSVKEKYCMVSLICESNEQNKLMSKRETRRGCMEQSDSCQRKGDRGLDVKW